jgi:hypothetical protein
MFPIRTTAGSEQQPEGSTVGLSDHTQEITTMQRRLAIALAAGITAATLGVAGGTASAAHCTDSGGPGNSDFAAHVQAASHSEGKTHKGWSSCIPGNPNFTG